MVQFELDQCGLKVIGDLREGDAEELGEWCRRLLDTGARVLRVDLSTVGRAHSRCIATLVSLQLDLRAAGRRLHLVPSPAVEKLLRLGGFGPLFLAETQP